MTRPAAKSPPVLPRLMRRQVAAAYVGVSPSKFDMLGIPRRLIGGTPVWDVRDLDAWADDLPYDGATAKGTGCDASEVWSG